MAPRAILSDLGNVVVHFDNERTVTALAALTGCAPAAVRKAAFLPGLCTRYGRGDLDTGQFMRIVMARMNVPKRDMPSEADFGRAFAEVFTPNDDVIARWRLLRAAGLTLTAVSNIEPLRADELRRMGIFSLFDHLVLSYEEKLVKPSAELMVRALDRSACAAEDALFVDDVEENLAPAAALGIRTHLYRSVGELDQFLEDCGL
jgi:HAD superfamily hydrolase (TIGR01509 family)